MRALHLAFLAALAGFLLAPASPAGAEDAPASCGGRNPLHCLEDTTPAPEPAAAPAPKPAATSEPPDQDVMIDPPGGCQGRNPLYCHETAPKVEVKPVPPETRERANDASRNPNRNANQNPNRNPNRNPRRRNRGAGGGG